jgi:prepilin-type processing-associated H-X9-DG protein
MLPKNAELTFSNITDGLSTTIAVLESAGRPLVYRRSGPVSSNPTISRVNAGGWVRPASDILFAGSNASGTLIPGLLINRTNGYDVAAETYGPSGYPSVGTEGSSQPFSLHPGGLNVLLGDGSVKLIEESVSISVFAALISRNGAGRDDLGNLKEAILGQNY